MSRDLMSFDIRARTTKYTCLIQDTFMFCLFKFSLFHIIILFYKISVIVIIIIIIIIILSFFFRMVLVVYSFMILIGAITYN